MSPTQNDKVYILGDTIDRGDESIKVLKDIMNRHNFILILGNHEVMLLSAVSPFIKNKEKGYSTSYDSLAFEDWMYNGGESTLQQFTALESWEQEEILIFLEESKVCETIEHRGKLYILAHAGIGNFSIDKDLDEYSLGDFVWGRTDYTKKYFPNGKIILVTGHTPTPLIRKDKRSLVYTGNGHIAIDCGCVSGGKLAAYCIETGKAVYVDAIKNK